MKSQLMCFYKFLKEIETTGNKVDGIEIGLPTENFEMMKVENFALLEKYPAWGTELKDVQEFNFNTAMGKLKIYNKDEKEKTKTQV